MKKIINPWGETEGYNCFGCAPQNPSGLHMEFYEDGDDIVSFWHPDGKYQGWLNTLHGGIQAVLLDEICGWVIMRKLQTAGVTSKMETRYLKPVHTTDNMLTLRASIREQRRNIVTIDASLFNEAGEICTQAVCTYFTFSREKALQDMHFHECKTEGE
ncbi:PaaI family thioesterase [Phocaeicola coprocola]|uniref:PaaI family thioesterase n=1 Tax=Phocaeicola coprocola TaxID=310298 RepID=UPI0039919818